MRRRSIVQLVVFLVLWGFITHGTFAGSGDEPHYLAIAHSIAFDRDLDVSNNYGRSEPFIAGGSLEPGLHARTGVGGELRPVHDVGLPLVFAPYVAVVRPLTAAVAANAPESIMRRARLTPSLLYRHALSMGMMLLAVVLAGRLFDAFSTLAAAPRATWWTLLVALSVPMLPYSVLFFTELLTALLAFSIVWSLGRTDRRRPGAWLALGAATGFLLLLHARNIGLAAGLAVAGAAIAWQSGTWRAALAPFAAGVIALVALRTAVNDLFWGSLLTGPHASPSAWPGLAATLREIARRAGGLAADQEYGLLIYAPVFVLAPFGWRALRRRDARLATLAAVAIAAYLLPVLVPSINRHGWTGGWCPPGRFLMPVVPLLALFVFSAGLALSRLIVLPLIVAQILLGAVFWNVPKLLWNDGDGRAAFCDRLPQRLCAALPSFVTPSDLVP
jgi:hypothetical protein